MTSKPVFLSYAFRPFFLLASVFAVISIAVWMLSWNGQFSLQKGMSPVYWHGHEMMLGFAMATIAGFTLSAVATWTGRPAVNGWILGWLVLTWLVGRIAVFYAGRLPQPVLAVLDSLFPLLLGLLFAREVVGARNKRNYKVVFLVFLLAGINASFFLVDARISLYLLIHTVVLLVALIGGRIVPNFTANWLRGQGKTNLPANNLLVDRLALTLSGTVGITASLFPAGEITATLAALAATVHAIRVIEWQGLQTTSNPLLFILHVAYWWLPIGYAMMALAGFGLAFSAAAALHALTMGAIGTTVLAMLTRVPLGHTGRALHASRLTVAAYWLLTIAVLARILGTVIPEAYLQLLNLAAIAWSLAFAIVACVYWPVLTGPPADS